MIGKYRIIILYCKFASTNSTILRMQYHFINNRIVHQSEAMVSAFDLSVMRGYGVFDFFKVLDGVPVFMYDHLQRFIHSAKKLNLTVPYPLNDLANIIYQLIDKNGIENGVFKIILTGGISSNGFNLDGNPCLLVLPGDLSFTVFDSFDGIKTLKIKTLDYVRETPGIKSINYLVAMMNWHLLKDGGYDDFLYVKNNMVSETSRANIFIIKNDVLITPKENILEGITRKHILEIGSKYLKVQERTISLQEVYEADEAFLTSTTKQAMPVIQIDEHLIKKGQPGEFTHLIFNDFHAVEMKYIRENKRVLV